MARNRADGPSGPEGDQEGNEGGRYSVLIEADLVIPLKMVALAEGAGSAPNWLNNLLRDILAERWPVVEAAMKGMRK